MQTKAAVKFRYPAALAVAAVVVLISAIPLTGGAPWLAPVLLVPLAAAAWLWRAGTDADADGLRVRALFGARRLRWDRIAHLQPTESGRVAAVLTDGHSVALTAVRAADLPRLVAASGGELAGTPEPTA